MKRLLAAPVRICIRPIAKILMINTSVDTEVSLIGEQDVMGKIRVGRYQLQLCFAVDFSFVAVSHLQLLVQLQFIRMEFLVFQNPEHSSE
jgi:hypothetical protein